jgi:uroporphyrinogen-III synthase
MRARDDVAATNVLYVTAEGSRDVLPEGLREIGAQVEVIHAYQSISGGEGADRLARAIEAGKVDVVTFTSGSSVRGYVDAVGAALATRVPAASIGPQTSEALRAAGVEVRCEAKESTIDGLVSAIVRGS